MSTSDHRFDYIDEIMFSLPPGSIYDARCREALRQQPATYPPTPVQPAVGPKRPFVMWGSKPEAASAATASPPSNVNPFSQLLSSSTSIAPSASSSNPKLNKLRAVTTPDWTRKKKIVPEEIPLPGYLVYLPPGAPSRTCNCRDCEYKRRFVRETPSTTDYRAHGAYASHGKYTTIFPHLPQGTGEASTEKESWLRRNVVWRQKSHKD